MSRDEISNKKHTCPCGRGFYYVSILMDDWNRMDESWIMECVNCKSKYDLYTYNYYDSGMSCEGHYWVPKEIYNKLKNQQNQLKKYKFEIIDYARLQYLKTWLDYFSDAKTKKEVWKRLTDNGQKCPSLTAFYTHTRNRELKDYLSGWFSFDSLNLITTKLGITDDVELDKRIQKVTEIKHEIEKIKRELQQNALT